MNAFQITLNGQPLNAEMAPTRLLVDFIRNEQRLTGTHIGCDTAQCGACTVLVDGQPVKSCSMLALQVQGRSVTTIEGLTAGDTAPLHPVQQAFIDCHGLQCGFCTPGMVMATIGLLTDKPQPSDREIAEALDGNLCRCTGYVNIVAAVHRAAELIDRSTNACRSGGMTAATPPDAALRFGSGQKVQRIEDPALVRGRGRFTDDAELPGQLHLMFLRSPHAHARIVSIDASQARAMPGVVAVLTGAELVDAGVLPIPARMPFKRPDGSAGQAPPRRPLAHQMVRFAGEAVAAVIAESPEAALDALDLVAVDYDDAACGCRSATGDRRRRTGGLGRRSRQCGGADAAWQSGRCSGGVCRRGACRHAGSGQSASGAVPDGAARDCRACRCGDRPADRLDLEPDADRRAHGAAGHHSRPAA